MNFGEILSRYEMRTGATTNRSYLAGLIDEAQIEIAKRYGEKARETYYDVDPEEEYELPIDHMETDEVRDKDHRKTTEFEITPDGRISFYFEGDYTFIYTKMPEPIDKDDNESEPDVHPIFHGMIVQYCVAKWWDDMAEGIPAEEAKAERLIHEFYRKVDEAAMVLRKRAFSENRIGVHPLVRS